MRVTSVSVPDIGRSLRMAREHTGLSLGEAAERAANVIHITLEHREHTVIAAAFPPSARSMIAGPSVPMSPRLSMRTICWMREW